MNQAKVVEKIRLKWLARFDADDEDQPKAKKHSAFSTRLPYGLCNSEGINTEGMTPREAWEAYASKTGKSVDDVKSEKMGESESKTRGRIANIKAKIDEVVGKKKELSDRKWKAEWDYKSAQSSMDIHKKELDEAKAQLKADLKDVSDEEISAKKAERGKRLTELTDWLDSNKKKYSEMTDEERSERRAKRDEKMAVEEEYYKYSDEDFQRSIVKRCEERYNEASQKYEEAQATLKAIQNEASSIEDDSEMRAEYDKLAKKRDKAVLDRFKSVNDCKTSEDVSDYLRAKGYYKNDDAYESDIAVNLDKMDVKSAKAFGDRFEKMFADYPFLVGHIGGVDCKGLSDSAMKSFDNSYAFAAGTHVTFNRDYFGGGKDGAESYKKGVESGWAPQGTTVNSIADHEYTHVLENLVNEKLEKGQRASDIVMRRVQERIDGQYLPENEDYYRFQVSEYAYNNKGIERSPTGAIIQVNDIYGGNTEWLAEAMSEARTSQNPREVARIAREEFEKLMREVKLL